MKPQITTQAALRQLFWENSGFKRHGRKKQNSYPADVRMAWVNFVDSMQKNGEISEKLAERATL